MQSVLIGIALVALGPLCAVGQSGDRPANENALAANSSASSDEGNAKKPHDATFIIGNDDLLDIAVWKEPELTKAIPVRSDGKISLPLVGEIVAAGRTPLQLENEISEKLKSYITTPEVTVIVEKVNSRKFNILGEISKPGSYPLTTRTTIMDAIATAGGFRDFAKKSGIYVLRKAQDGHEARLKFNYKDFIKGKDISQNINLEPDDTIIVP